MNAKGGQYLTQTEQNVNSRQNNWPTWYFQSFCSESMNRFQQHVAWEDGEHVEQVIGC